MKKLIAYTSSVALYGVPAAVLAQLPNEGGLTELNNTVNLGNRPLIETIGQLINVGLGLLGVIAVVGIIWGGFLTMTAAGDEEKAGSGKKAIAAGVIGLLIILAAFAIASFVIDRISAATY